MASAALLALEELRATPRRAEGRQRLGERFEHWVDRVEAQVKEPSPTAEERTPVLLALRQEVTPAVTDGLVEHAHRALVEQRMVVCPHCGLPLSARGPVERTVETPGGSDSAAAPRR